MQVTYPASQDGYLIWRITMNYDGNDCVVHHQMCLISWVKFGTQILYSPCTGEFEVQCMLTGTRKLNISSGVDWLGVKSPTSLEEPYLQVIWEYEWKLSGMNDLYDTYEEKHVIVHVQAIYVQGFQCFNKLSYIIHDVFHIIHSVVKNNGKNTYFLSL